MQSLIGGNLGDYHWSTFLGESVDNRNLGNLKISATKGSLKCNFVSYFNLMLKLNISISIKESFENQFSD